MPGDLTQGDAEEVPKGAQSSSWKAAPEKAAGRKGRSLPNTNDIPNEHGSSRNTTELRDRAARWHPPHAPPRRQAGQEVWQNEK